jgi:hypothetical protein
MMELQAVKWKLFISFSLDGYGLDYRLLKASDPC